MQFCEWEGQETAHKGHAEVGSAANMATLVFTRVW